MNDKYKFSKFLTSLYSIQKFIPSRAWQRYFDRIRTLLSQQYEAVKLRKKKKYDDEFKHVIEKRKHFFVLAIEDVSHEKTIDCKRLGLTYTKVITRAEDNFFHIEYKNLIAKSRLTTTKAQRLRRRRFVNKEASQDENRFSKRLVASFCRKKFNQL
ncbi:hypothetical protein C1646_762285 [Rhizophagus diaphanus]|nr:hypothetical protein C1646_762285 [Rhizophagus diaphanus] [Rhizophagus sp. MUCL 43196]